MPDPASTCGLFSPQVCAALIGVSGVIATLGVNEFLHHRNNKREIKTTITAIRSDVRSLVLAIHSTRLVESFIETHKSKNDEPQFPPWSDGPRGENYFALYEAFSPSIGKLPPKLAREIVRFYTYLRVSRDAAAPFAEMRKNKPTNGDHRRHAENALVAMKQMFSAATEILASNSGQSGKDEGAPEANDLIKFIEEHLENYYKEHPTEKRISNNEPEWKSKFMKKNDPKYNKPLLITDTSDQNLLSRSEESSG